MELSLTLKENKYLTKEESQEIEKRIDEIILKHKGNAFEINRLVFDSVTALTASESRSNELAEQGTFKRLWGGITGKNQEFQSEIDRNLARAQYSSQQTLQKLAEQNLMSFDLITAVNNKLNSSIIEIESEINKIYGTLVTFFKQTKSNLIQLENRVERLENNVNLLNWLNTIEYQMYNGIEYSELNKFEKIVCIVRDFYDITKGNWTTSNLLLLKPALAEIGLSVKETISYKEFLEDISENTGLFNKLMQEDTIDLAQIDATQVPIINGLSKVKLLELEEKYIVNTLKLQLKAYGVEEDDKKLRYSIVENYLKETAFINISSQVNMFDFILELLLNIKISNYEISNKYINDNMDFENVDYKIVKKYAEKGNEKAQYELGKRYYNGEIVEQNYEEALKWFKLSAGHGNSEAQVIVALIYKFKMDTDESQEQFEKYIEMASNKKHAIAQFFIGVENLEENSEIDGLEYLKLAAFNGVNEENIIACNLFMEFASEWVDEALSEVFDGKVEIPSIRGAMFLLAGAMYISEEKVYEGIEFIKISFNEQFVEAAYLLGMIYYDGEGLAKDKKEALKWLEKSAEKGCKEAKKFIEENY